MLNVTVPFDLLTPKSIEIISVSWPSLVPRKVDLHVGEISLTLIGGQEFANAGQTDGRTDRRTARHAV